MRATDGLQPRFGQPEVPDLAFANQVFDRTGDVFDWHVGVDAVLVEEVDPIGLEPLQRRLRHLTNVRRPAVQPSLLAVVELEAELGGDHDLVAHWTKRLADQLFVRERSVGFGRVEERDAALEGRADDGNALGMARRLTVAEADPHAAEPDG